MIMAFFYTQFMYKSFRLEHLDEFEIGLAISLLLFILYGEPGYSSVPTSGPYAVGFREFKTKELWNDCSVYYPVDKDVAKKYEQEGNGTVYLLRYLKSLNGFVASTTWRDGGQKGFNRVRSKFMTFVSIPMAFEAPLANDFSKGHKKL